MDKIPFRYAIADLCREMELELSDISPLYSEYFIEMRNNLENARTCVLQNRWENLERLIHNIKGISISLKITDIYFISNKLDNELKKEVFDNVSHSISMINEFLTAAESDIRQFFKENGIII